LLVWIGLHKIVRLKTPLSQFSDEFNAPLAAAAARGTPAIKHEQTRAADVIISRLDRQTDQELAYNGNSLT